MQISFLKSLRLTALIFVGFSLQNIFLKSMFLFFKDASQINLLMPISLGLAFGTYMFSKKTQWTNLIPNWSLLLVCMVFAASTLIYINEFLFVFLTFLIFSLLGLEIASELEIKSGSSFILSDIIGSLLGSIFGYSLPSFLGLEASFFLVVTIISLFNIRIRFLSLFFACFTFVLAIDRNLDLTVYGANFKNPILSSETHMRDSAQLTIGNNDGTRILNEWSSLGKIEFIQFSKPEKKVVAYSNNRGWFTVHESNNFVNGSQSTHKKALVIGAGGGSEVTFLLNLGAHVTALEINEIAHRELQKRLSKSDPNLKVVLYNREGRNFVQKTNERFDYIFLTNLGTNGATFGERDITLHTYLLTKEAFQSYFDRLNEGGMIVTNSRFDLKNLNASPALPIISTITATLNEMNKTTRNHLQIFATHEPNGMINKESPLRVTFFLSKSPVGRSESKFIEDFFGSLWETSNSFTSLYGSQPFSSENSDLKNVQLSITGVTENNGVGISKDHTHILKDNYPFISKPKSLVFQMQTVLSTLILCSLAFFLFRHKRRLNRIDRIQIFFVFAVGFSGSIAEMLFLVITSLHMLTISQSFFITTTAFALGATIALIYCLKNPRLSIHSVTFLVGAFACVFSLFFQKIAFVFLSNEMFNLVGFLLFGTLFSFVLSIPFSLFFLRIKEAKSDFFLPLWIIYLVSFSVGTQIGSLFFYSFGLKETLFFSGLIMTLASTPFFHKKQSF